MSANLVHTLGFELAYLSLLTNAGVKPLSRWEAHYDAGTVNTLGALGLKTQGIGRLAQSGKRVRELVFSRSASCLALYQARFHRAALRPSHAGMRLEGRLFGYPACCVEHFIAQGYARNGLDRQTQRMLFHWACPQCALTPLLVPQYQRLYEACQAMTRRQRSPARFRVRDERFAAPVRRTMVLAAALATMGLGGPAGLPMALGGGSHLTPLPVETDRDGDYLTLTEEALLDRHPAHPDEDGNLKLDGVDLAQSLLALLDALPATPQTNQPYALPNLMFGLETCQVCGASVNMGFLQLVNPSLNQSMTIPYIAHHFLEQGSFTYAGSLHSGRLNAAMLNLLLTGQGDAHLLPIASDTDGDLLTDLEETDLGKNPQNPDEDGNYAPDGLELARAVAAEIAALPTTPATNTAFRLDFRLRGLERCDLCGENVNMGHLTVCNPVAQLYAKVPYITLHGLEHGSWAFAGDVHGAGRAEVRLLLDTLHSTAPSHLRSVAGDADGDGLKDAEEHFYQTDEARQDTDNDGVPDGFHLARELWRDLQALPTTPSPGRTWLVREEADCYAPCPVCRRPINCGNVEVRNTWAGLSVRMSFLNLHFLEQGSLAVSATERVDPLRLSAALRPAVVIVAPPNQTTLCWEGKAGRTYQVWSAPTLSGPWTAGLVVGGTDTNLVLNESRTNSEPQKFYKIVAQ